MAVEEDEADWFGVDVSSKITKDLSVRLMVSAACWWVLSVRHGGRLIQATTCYCSLGSFIRSMVRRIRPHLHPHLLSQSVMQVTNSTRTRVISQRYATRRACWLRCC